MMVLDMFFKEYFPGKSFTTKIIFLGLTFMMVLDMFFEEYFPGKRFCHKDYNIILAAKHFFRKYYS